MTDKDKANVTYLASFSKNYKKHLIKQIRMLNGFYKKKLTSSKRIWKIVKPSFTDKEIKNEKNIFIVEGETISVDNKI